MFRYSINKILLYGFARGIVYNFDRKDKNNNELLITDKLFYIGTSTLFFMPFFVLPSLYFDCRNIELLLRNRQNELTQDTITSFIFNTHELNKVKKLIIDE
jgi:hypothetical protein